MADNAPAPGSLGQGRGGRRRGRGGAPPSGRADAQQNSGEGGNRGGRSRGRGGKNSGGRDKQQNSDGARKDPEPASTATVGTKQVAAATDDADDGEVCFICASKVEHTSVSPCNHRTCHICALRLRALYKSKSCAHCRVSLPPRSPAIGSQPALWVPMDNVNLYLYPDRKCLCGLYRRSCAPL